MQFNEKVQAALRHVHGFFPDVTQVFYGADGRWMFCDEDFEAPNFDEASGKVDISLLEDAADAADNDKGFPCAYRLLPLAESKDAVKACFTWVNRGEVFQCEN